MEIKFIAFYCNEGIRRLHVSQMDSLKEKCGRMNLYEQFMPEKEETPARTATGCHPTRRNQLTVIRWLIIHQWLGIQPEYHAVVDKTPAWG